MNDLEREKELLIVRVSKGRSVFYSYKLGDLEHIETIENDVPNTHVDISPTHIQQHSIELMKRHLRETGHFIDKYLESHPQSLFVIEGEENISTEFSHGQYFGKSMQNRHIGTIHLSPGHTQDDFINKLQNILEEYEAVNEEKALEDIGTFSSTNQVLEGLRNVLRAQNRFFISRMLMNEGFKQAGYRCKVHPYLSLEKKSCPTCNEELLPVDNVADELIELAYQNRVKLTLVRTRKDVLDQYGGVVGVTYNSESAKQILTR